MQAVNEYEFFDGYDALKVWPEWQTCVSILLFNPWHNVPEFRTIALAQVFASAAAQLLDVPAVRLYCDEIAFKGPGRPASLWHQDAFGSPLRGSRMVTCWIPLMRIEPQMGSIMFANGSHNDGLIRIGEIKGPLQDDLLKAYVAERGFEVVEDLQLNPGDVTFHHGHALHAARPNDSDVMRMNVCLTFVADGERILEPTTITQEVELAQVLRGLHPGDPVGGPLHPIVYPKS